MQRNFQDASSSIRPLVRTPLLAGCSLPHCLASPSHTGLMLRMRIRPIRDPVDG